MCTQSGRMYQKGLWIFHYTCTIRVRARASIVRRAFHLRARTRLHCVHMTRRHMTFRRRRIFLFFFIFCNVRRQVGRLINAFHHKHLTVALYGFFKRRVINFLESLNNNFDDETSVLIPLRFGEISCAFRPNISCPLLIIVSFPYQLPWTVIKY